jgi:hypothetical protein
LRSYTRCFFNNRATIANISDEDVIDCFQNDFAERHLYQDFGRNRPKTFVELHDMMQQWADQEDHERDRFPKCNNDNGGKRNNNNRSNKGQRDYSGSSRKSKPDSLIAAIDRNPRVNKSGNQQEQFDKILHKQCLMHPKSKHTLFECISLHKS